MLLGQFGLGILKTLRSFSDIPVLILSARDSEFDRVLGLELGTDDYVVKPFSPKEVAALVKVILKRMDKNLVRHELTFTTPPYSKKTAEGLSNAQSLCVFSRLLQPPVKFLF